MNRLWFDKYHLTTKLVIEEKGRKRGERYRLGKKKRGKRGQRKNARTKKKKERRRRRQKEEEEDRKKQTLPQLETKKMGSEYE